MTYKVCYYCEGNEEETRPYGPGGTDVCFTCAMSTPERREVTSNNFHAQLSMVAAVSDTIVIGTDKGPTSLKDAMDED